MSELYEGVIVVADPAAMARAFQSYHSPHILGFDAIRDNVFGVYTRADRQIPFDHEETTRIAAHLSLTLGATLAVFYDNRCGINTADLYRNGQYLQTFTEADATWVALDVDGEPILTGPTFATHELRDDTDEEYDYLHSPIDIGLMALGVPPGVDAAELKQAFCYTFSRT
jgi:hypothetical protein